MPDPSLTIIGPGKVGGLLARLAPAAGWRVAGVAGRDRERGTALVTAAGLDTATPVATLEALPDGWLAGSDLVALTVPDDALAAVAGRLTGPAAAGAVAFHCSGAQGAAVLDSMRSAGFAVGSLHPLQTIPDAATTAVRFAGTPCAVEGDARAVKALAAFATAIGGEPFAIPAGSKALYHAAAVVACNYLVTLEAAATALFEPLGVDRTTTLRRLLPIIRGTVDALDTHGLPAALTGPVERGDVATVRAHLDAMAEAAPGMIGLYTEMGRRTVELALEKGTLTLERAAKLRGLFDGTEGK